MSEYQLSSLLTVTEIRNMAAIISDARAAKQVALTAGSDISPTLNYVYILQSNKTLTVSTGDWPSDDTCHFKWV